MFIMVKRLEKIFEKSSIISAGEFPVRDYLNFSEDVNEVNDNVINRVKYGNFIGKIGDKFYGVSGPMYLAGLIVLLTGIVSFAYVFMKVLDNKLPKLPVKEEKMHLFNSILSGLMLILAASVYFHPKFGINIVDKSA